MEEVQAVHVSISVSDLIKAELSTYCKRIEELEVLRRHHFHHEGFLKIVGTEAAQRAFEKPAFRIGEVKVALG